MVRILGFTIGGKRKPFGVIDVKTSSVEEDAELKVVLKELNVVNYTLAFITSADKAKAGLLLSSLKEGGFLRIYDLKGAVGSLDNQRKQFEQNHKRGPFILFNPPKDGDPSTYKILIGICIELVTSAEKHDTMVMKIADSIRNKTNELPQQLQGLINNFEKMLILKGGNLIRPLEALIKKLNILQAEFNPVIFNGIHQDLLQIITEIKKVFEVKRQVEAHLNIKL